VSSGLSNPVTRACEVCALLTAAALDLRLSVAHEHDPARSFLVLPSEALEPELLPPPLRARLRRLHAGAPFVAPLSAEQILALLDPDASGDAFEELRAELHQPPPPAVTRLVLGTSKSFHVLYVVFKPLAAVGSA
jgi:hypothetical protein